MAEPAQKSPEETVQELKRLVAAGDVANMMQVIGDLHENWNQLSVDTQDEVRQLEAVFLSMLKAKSKAGK